MLVLHGASWLSVKAEQGAVLDRARRFGTIAGIAALVLFAAGGLYVAYGGLGYRITGALDVNGFSNPLRTTVEAAPGAWLDNYGRYPWMLIAPVLGFLGSAVALVGMWRRSAALAFGGSSLSAVGIISTVGLSMFPFILPSSVDPQVQPDGVELVLQPPDAVHHADRDGRLPAVRAALHRLGLPGVVGSDIDRCAQNQP